MNIPVIKSTGNFVTDGPITDFGSEDSAVYELDTGSGIRAHVLEHAVQHALTWEANLKFTSLVVRRVEGGVSLYGKLVCENKNEVPNLKKLVKTLTGAVVVTENVVVCEQKLETKSHHASVMPWNS